MIINDIKYACRACIKGHRATTCKHADRELIEIKRTGRPSTQCDACKELRRIKQLHIKCEHQLPNSKKTAAEAPTVRRHDAAPAERRTASENDVLPTFQVTAPPPMYRSASESSGQSFENPSDSLSGSSAALPLDSLPFPILPLPPSAYPPAADYDPAPAFTADEPYPFSFSPTDDALPASRRPVPSSNATATARAFHPYSRPSPSASAPPASPAAAAQTLFPGVDAQRAMDLLALEELVGRLYPGTHAADVIRSLGQPNAQQPQVQPPPAPPPPPQMGYPCFEPGFGFETFGGLSGGASTVSSCSGIATPDHPPALDQYTASASADSLDFIACLNFAIEGDLPASAFPPQQQQQAHKPHHALHVHSHGYAPYSVPAPPSAAGSRRSSASTQGGSTPADEHHQPDGGVRRRASASAKGRSTPPSGAAGADVQRKASTGSSKADGLKRRTSGKKNAATSAPPAATASTSQAPCTGGAGGARLRPLLPKPPPPATTLSALAAKQLSLGPSPAAPPTSFPGDELSPTSASTSTAGCWPPVVEPIDFESYASYFGETS